MPAGAVALHGERRSRRFGLWFLGSVIAATVLIWAIAALSVLLFARGAREPRTRQLVIPAGTRTQVGSGANPLEIPPSLSFVAGDRLLVRNEDRVSHAIGGYLVRPGHSTTIRLEPSPAGSFACTLHPSGVLGIDVQPRGLDLRLTLLPTLLLGPALGTGVALVWRVVSRLRVE